MLLHPIHGGAWQRRELGPLAEEVILSAGDDLAEHGLEVENGTSVNIKGCDLEVRASNGTLIVVPLLFAQLKEIPISSEAGARLLLVLPYSSDKDKDRAWSRMSAVDDTPSMEVRSGDDRYICRACLTRGLRGWRCCVDSGNGRGITERSGDGIHPPTPPWVSGRSEESGQETSVQTLCPQCVMRRRAFIGSPEAWLFVVPEGSVYGGDPNMNAVRAALYQAGAIRKDLGSSFDINPKEIGRGSQAIAYRLQSKETHGNFSGVVKCFTGKTPEEAQNILREVSVLASVQQHPNVIGFQGFFHTDSEDNIPEPDAAGYALLMEFCNGGDLMERFISGNVKYNEEKAAETITGLLAALAHIHSKDIVHRDVKPENILFDAEDRVILADFGLACHVSDAAQMTRRCGSAGYCAPEVILSLAYDCKVDVFSAGAVLYTLLQNGKKPFRGQNVHSVLRRTMRCHVEFDVGVDGVELSATCQTFVLLLLKRSPRHRPTAQGALLLLWMKRAGVDADGDYCDRDGTWNSTDSTRCSSDSQRQPGEARLVNVSPKTPVLPAVRRGKYKRPSRAVRSPESNVMPEGAADERSECESLRSEDDSAAPRDSERFSARGTTTNGSERFREDQSERFSCRSTARNSTDGGDSCYEDWERVSDEREDVIFELPPSVSDKTDWSKRAAKFRNQVGNASALCDASQTSTARHSMPCHGESTAVLGDQESPRLSHPWRRKMWRRPRPDETARSTGDPTETDRNAGASKEAKDIDKQDWGRSTIGDPCATASGPMGSMGAMGPIEEDLSGEVIVRRRQGGVRRGATDEPPQQRYRSGKAAAAKYKSSQSENKNAIEQEQWELLMMPEMEEITGQSASSSSAAAAVQEDKAPEEEYGSELSPVLPLLPTSPTAPAPTNRAQKFFFKRLVRRNEHMANKAHVEAPAAPANACSTATSSQDPAGSQDSIEPRRDTDRESTVRSSSALLSRFSQLSARIPRPTL